MNKRKRQKAILKADLGRPLSRKEKQYVVQLIEKFSSSYSSDIEQRTHTDVTRALGGAKSIKHVDPITGLTEFSKADMEILAYEKQCYDKIADLNLIATYFPATRNELEPYRIYHTIPVLGKESTGQKQKARISKHQ